MRELKDTENDLENWYFCYRDTYIRRVTKSLEGRFKPEAGDIFDTVQPKHVLDHLRAHETESAIVGLPFVNKFAIAIDRQYSFILKEGHESKFHKACKKLKIYGRDYNSKMDLFKLLVKKSIQMLHNRLTMKEVFR